MHLCYLSNEYPKPGHAHGGIGSFLKVICPALVAAGHHVTVINGTYGLRESVVREGVNIIYTPFSTKKGIAWWQNFKALNSEIKALHHTQPIDVIEGSELGFAFLDKIDGIAYVIRLHGGHHFFAEGEQRPINAWKGFQEKRSFKKADGFIAVSQYVANHTAKFLPMTSKPLKVIMYPINLKMFTPSSFEQMTPYRLVFAGTLIEKKGIRQLVEAMKSIVERFPDTELYAYGRDWKDAYGNSYLEKLQQTIPPSLKSKIHFPGSVDQTDLPSIYEKANLCVFPSHIETLGLVAPEAMAMQRPVLYTTTGPGPEVITHGESGWLCNPHDAADIADKVIEVFSNPEESRRRAKVGLDKVDFQFNVSNILGQNLDFYSQVIESKKGA